MEMVIDGRVLDLIRVGPHGDACGARYAAHDAITLNGPPFFRSRRRGTPGWLKADIQKGMERWPSAQGFPRRSEARLRHDVR